MAAHPTIRVGVIGLDSSHTLQFSRRMYALHAQGRTKCLVTSCWDSCAPSESGASESPADSAAAPLRALGIQFPQSLDELLASVDAAMILAVDGHRHFDLAMNALARGLPTFIDKPLTCSASEADSLLQFCRTHNARCYSASALRFIEKVPPDTNTSLGRLVSISASGPFQETPQMSGLWYYACHTFELLDSLWQTAGGLHRIRAEKGPSGHRVELEYHDGRTGVIGLDLDGTAPFSVLLRGETSSTSYVADLSSSYDRLVASICRFFEGARPDFPLENTAETIIAIECAHRSLARGGAWVSLRKPLFSPSPNRGSSSQKN